MLNQFYQQFWVGTFAEHGSAVAAQEAGDEGVALQQFYEKYRDRFVSEYAATNPIEDLAEIFTHFVLKDKPVDTDIASEKISFLYQFARLVDMRRGIRAKLGRPSKRTG